jgi:hydroxyacylglutathione hydrolase
MRITPWLYMVGSRQFGLSSPCDCHIYALRGPDGRVLLIDAGSGLATARVVESIREEFGSHASGVILVTHKHPDHAAGAASLSAALGWPVWTSVYTRDVLQSGDAREAGLIDAQAVGGYPADMTYPACRVDRTFDDGEVIEPVAGLPLRAIRVRGHSDDAMAFYFEHSGGRCLLSADIVFYGGIIGLIHSHDSSLAGYRADFGKVTSLQVDALLPSHGLFTLQDGQQHIDLAAEELRQGFVPRCIGQGDRIF